MENVNIHQAFIIPPPPPPHLPSVQLPVSGLTIEATHAQKRESFLESIKQSGGFGKIPLKHVPLTEQHVPGQQVPASLLAKPLPPGAKVDLMGDLNAVLLQRKMGRGGRGGSVKMGHTMRMLGACAPIQTRPSKKQPEPQAQPPQDSQESTDF